MTGKSGHLPWGRMLSSALWNAWMAGWREPELEAPGVQAEFLECLSASVVQGHGLGKVQLRKRGCLYFPGTNSLAPNKG